MQYQPTNNLFFSDAGIDLSAQIKAEMEKKGIKPIQAPLTQAVDFGIDVPKRKPMRERELSTTELLNLFDRKESLQMVYIPHFITQCIMYYIDAMCQYMVEHRLSEYKKLKRILTEIKREYYAALRHEMPFEVFQKFQAQRDEYLANCGANLQIMYFTFCNELSHNFKHVENEAIVCYAYIVVSLAQHIEDFDRSVNKKIAEKLNMPTRNHGDARLAFAKRVCMDVVKPYWNMGQTQQTELAMNIIANKAKQMINDMLK